MNKFLIESGMIPRMFAMKKKMTVMVRVGGSWMLMAHISGDAEVEWLEHSLCNYAVN